VANIQEEQVVKLILNQLLFFHYACAAMTSIENLGTDIASRMLSALTLDSEADRPENTTIVSLDDQKRYLQKHIDSLSIADRKEIGEILIRNGRKSSLNWCSSGTVINLDSLTHEIVEQMYNLMVYKRNR
jgi:hypothetical protein